ncbi:MAG: glycosyltransferase family 2 protein [Alphaproteobacteria bacterium]|nr:glycosyltransferase family 2 protein [Alphaproteobacteria bacterium]
MKKIILFVLFVLFIVVGGFIGKKVLERPAISVVMSTYNRASFLPKSIESILNQTFTDFEFIIINDGSPDETDKILNLFAKKDKRIRVITNEQNKGLIYSLNLGLDLAKGKYIARMDDDDVSMPTRFEKQYAYMEANPDVAVVASWVGRPDNKRPWGFQNETDPEKLKVLMYLNTVPISHPASFLRRDFLEKHNIRYSYDYKAAEDRKFWLDIADAGGKISNIPEVLLLFRLHNSNPKEYYTDQWKNLNKFFQQEILRRFGTEQDFKGLDKCQISKKMLERNKTLNYVSQSALNEMVIQICPPENGEWVVHSNWKDYFVFNDNRVCRHYAPRECANIINKTDDTLTIKWERWGTEIFEKKGSEWHLLLTK